MSERIVIPNDPGPADLIEAMCRLRSVVAGYFGWRYASDCMCGQGPDEDMWRDDGVVFDFIQDAVWEKMEREPLEPSALQILFGGDTDP